MAKVSHSFVLSYAKKETTRVFMCTQERSVEEAGAFDLVDWISSWSISEKKKLDPATIGKYTNLLTSKRITSTGATSKNIVVRFKGARIYFPATLLETVHSYTGMSNQQDQHSAVETTALYNFRQLRKLRELLE